MYLVQNTIIYRTVNEIRDRLFLQEDLNKLHQWPNIWLLKFSANKYKVMHLGSKKQKLNI